MTVLSVNIGSSSIKFALYAVVGEGGLVSLGKALAVGQITGLQSGGTPAWRVDCCDADDAASDSTAPALGRQAMPTPTLNLGDGLDAGIAALVRWLECLPASLRVWVVAHRVVHGGGVYTGPVRVDAAALDALARFNSLAPLHQPFNLAGIRALQTLWPTVPQVACFDTAFHVTQPELETRFALPQSICDLGVRRYGFHGLSYTSILQTLQNNTSRSQGRVLMAHLGNGASVCATLGGRSQASSMGFSALDGLMMGTRSGALDPGVLLYLLEQGWNHDALEDLLYRQSGLLGVSGISADMRQLRADGSPPARFAIDLFAHRVVRECGAMMACMGGLDVLAFSGGIGEHDARLRQQVCDALQWAGVKLDTRANDGADGSRPVAVHAVNSPIDIWVVPTDEGRVAAEQALQVLAQLQSDAPSNR